MDTGFNAERAAAQFKKYLDWAGEVIKAAEKGDILQTASPADGPPLFVMAAAITLVTLSNGDRKITLNGLEIIKALMTNAVDWMLDQDEQMKAPKH